MGYLNRSLTLLAQQHNRGNKNLEEKHGSNQRQKGARKKLGEGEVTGKQMIVQLLKVGNQPGREVLRTKGQSQL